MKYLGIDYGTKRIGLATSDEEGRVAFPKEVIPNDNKVLEVLERYIKEEGVECIVLGESKNYLMEDNDIMTEVLDLKKILETTMEVDVKMHSEVLSSVQAKKMGASDKMLDASAAAVILQSYLESKNV
jgi:putative Holliday junction resolvase